jgi:hypothetical protein
LSFELRAYTDADEQGWLRCRVLGFLDSAFYDDVRRERALRRAGDRALA